MLPRSADPCDIDAPEGQRLAFWLAMVSAETSNV
jgi:hypothetical protein